MPEGDRAEAPAHHWSLLFVLEQEEGVVLTQLLLHPRRTMSGSLLDMQKQAQGHGSRMDHASAWHGHAQRGMAHLQARLHLPIRYCRVPTEVTLEKDAICLIILSGGHEEGVKAKDGVAHALYDGRGNLQACILRCVVTAGAAASARCCRAFAPCIRGWCAAWLLVSLQVIVVCFQHVDVAMVRRP